MPKPDITVIIDTFNYGCFIEEAIESVLSQEFGQHGVEVLVVDDGSTDDTAERVKRFGAKIEYFRKSNGGQASAFNSGISRAKGDIIMLLDADDYWLPGKISRVLGEFNEHPGAGMVYHRWVEREMGSGRSSDADFSLISGFVPSSVRQVMSFSGLTTSCMAFRRNVLEQLLPIPDSLTIQADAYIGTLATFLTPVVGLDERLAVYRVHSRNLYFNLGDDLDPVRLRRRIATREALVDGLSAWFNEHGYNSKKGAVRATLQRWVLLSDNDRFRLSPPGRITFFLHLLRYNRQYRPLIKRRLHLINYLNAFGSLIVGYKYFGSLDAARERLVRWFRGGL
jgi:glycosyltransferase involved in cell wall biosynthesis